MNTQRYMGFAAQIAVASNMAFTEIWNPATTKKTVKVTRIEMLCTDTIVSLWHHTATQAAGAGSVAGVKGNRDLGGVACSATIRGQDILTTVVGTKFYTFTTVSGTVKILDLENSPLIIRPGKGLVVACDTVNKAITRAMFQWHEIDSSY